MSIIVSMVGIERADAVMAVMEGAFDPQYHEAWTRPQLIGQMLLPGSKLWLAERAGEAVGFALCNHLLDEAELMLLAVMPDARRQRVGERLIEAIVDALSASGVMRLFLEVRESNAARDFYGVMQFVPVGRRPGYYRTGDGTLIDAITMCRQVYAS